MKHVEDEKLVTLQGYMAHREIAWQLADLLGGVGLCTGKVSRIGSKWHLRCLVQAVARQVLEQSAGHRDPCKQRP